MTPARSDNRRRNERHVGALDNASVLDAHLAPTAGCELFVMGHEHDRHVGVVVQLEQQICDKKLR